MSNSPIFYKKVQNGKRCTQRVNFKKNSGFFKILSFLSRKFQILPFFFWGQKVPYM